MELDPDFALAHSAYADANLLLATYGLVHPKEALIKAKQSAEKALQLILSLVSLIALWDIIMPVSNGIGPNRRNFLEVY
jgi:hypothetical protein